jgi:hypothetical protein
MTSWFASTSFQSFTNGFRLALPDRRKRGVDESGKFAIGTHERLDRESANPTEANSQIQANSPF